MKSAKRSVLVSKNHYQLSLMATQIDEWVKKLVESGVEISEICKECEISDDTLRNYRKGISEPKISVYRKIEAMAAHEYARESATAWLKEMGFSISSKIYKTFKK